MSGLCAGESITMFKDVVLACAAFVGMLVAVSGLTTWNRQLKGGVEYELTRRLLRCTYLLREAIKEVRYPIMLVEEMAVTEEQKQQGMPDNKHTGLFNAYQTRWSKVITARSNLHTELLEAEVVWTKDIHDKFAPLFALQKELFSDIHLHLELSKPNQNNESKAAWRDMRANRRSVMYDMLGAIADPFSDEIEAAIGNIESYLKPHLAK